MSAKTKVEHPVAENRKKLEEPDDPSPPAEALTHVGWRTCSQWPRKQESERRGSFRFTAQGLAQFPCGDMSHPRQAGNQRSRPSEPLRRSWPGALWIFCLSVLRWPLHPRTIRGSHHQQDTPHLLLIFVFPAFSERPPPPSSPALPPEAQLSSGAATSAALRPLSSVLGWDHQWLFLVCRLRGAV